MNPDPLCGQLPTAADLDAMAQPALGVAVADGRILCCNQLFLQQHGPVAYLDELVADAALRRRLLDPAQVLRVADSTGPLRGRLSAAAWMPGVAMVLIQPDADREDEELHGLLALVAELVWDWDVESGTLQCRDHGLARAGHEATVWPATLGDALALIHPDDLPELRGELAAFLRAGDAPLLLEFRLALADGSHRWVVARGRCVERGADGRVRRIRGMLSDVHERRSAETDRDRLEEQLRHVQKLDALGQLTGGIAHDFNNILASVMGYAELGLLDGAGRAPLHGYFEEIRQAADRGRELIGKLLLFSRGGRSRGERISAGPLVQDVVRMLRPMLPTTLQVELAVEEAVADISMDPIQLQQLVLNLAINARDAVGENGTLGLTVATRSRGDAVCASCKTALGGAWVTIVVSDDGPGVAPEDVEKIFDPFFTTKEASRGSGLGLSVVHGIVHEHGGHVLLDSRPGEGTRFSLLLPAVDGPKPRLQVPTAEQLPHSGRGQRLMVVDDEPVVGQAMGRLLERHGYQADPFSDARAALDAFVAGPDAYSLVLTDQAMPGLSGIELADEMLVLRPDMPIVVCTGYSEFVDAGNAADMGFAAFLGKPVSSRELLGVLDRLLTESDRVSSLPRIQ